MTSRLGPGESRTFRFVVRELDGKARVFESDCCITAAVEMKKKEVCLSIIVLHDLNFICFSSISSIYSYYYKLEKVTIKPKIRQELSIHIKKDSIIYLLFGFAGFVRYKCQIMIQELSESHEHGRKPAHVFHVFGSDFEEVSRNLVSGWIVFGPSCHGFVSFLVNVER